MLTHNPKPFLKFYFDKIYFSFYNPIVAVYRILAKPHNYGVKMFLFREDKVLMVRIGYAHRKWVFPGGAIDKGEAPKDAAIRELYEEAGIKVDEATFVKEKFWQRTHGKVTVQYFCADTDTEDIIIDDQEIVDAGWFSLNDLPKNRTIRVDEELALYNNWKDERYK